MESGIPPGKAFQYKPLGFSLGLLAQPVLPSAATPSAALASSAPSAAAGGPPTNALQLLASTPLGKSLLSSLLPPGLTGAGTPQVGTAPCQGSPGITCTIQSWPGSIPVSVLYLPATTTLHGEGRGA